MRLPSKRKTQSSGHGTREVFDDLMDLGEFPSSSSSATRGQSRKKRKLTSGRAKAKKGCYAFTSYHTLPLLYIFCFYRLKG